MKTIYSLVHSLPRIEIDLKPFQGLKHKMEVSIVSLPIGIEIDLKPFQGLKLYLPCRTVYISHPIEIDLKPFQGLKPVVYADVVGAKIHRNRPQTLSGIETESN